MDGFAPRSDFARAMRRFDRDFAGSYILRLVVEAPGLHETGTVKGANADEVWDRILRMHSDCAGRQLTIDRDVYKSESDTNQRNRAISMLMSAYERFPSDPAVAVDLYTRQCSINVSAVMPSMLLSMVTSPNV